MSMRKQIIAALQVEYGGHPIAWNDLLEVVFEELLKPTQGVLDAGANALGMPRNPRPGQSKNDEPMMALSAMIGAMRDGQ